jgi:type IV secretory pathway VirB2 component (pilin)
VTKKKPRPQAGGEVLTVLLALCVVGLLALLLPPQVLAQSPWESSAQKLQTAFTGPIAKALSLVAIVVGGLMFAYGEGQGKKVVAGIVFGVGMAVGAMNFLAWLF